MTTLAQKRQTSSERSSYVAAFILIGFVALVTYIAFGHPTIGSQYKVDAVVKSSNQIITGQPVRIAGVDVGKITDIKPGPGHTTKIEMTLKDAARPLHTDASLKIRPRLFLEGGYYVDMQAGSPSAPEIDNGGTIPLSQTAIPTQLNDVLSTFDSGNRRDFTSIVKEMHTAVSNGGATSFRRTAPNLAPVFRDLAWVSKASLGTAPHDVSQFVASAAKITSALSERDTHLAGLVVNLDRTAQALDSGDEALGRSVEAFNRILKVSPPALAGVAAALPTLRSFSRVLAPALPAAPRQLADINAAVEELAKIVEPKQRARTIAALSTTFADLPNLVQRLAGLFPVTRPLIDCLGARIVPMLNSKVPDGKLSTGQPAWQEFAHAVVGFSGVSENFDANGPWARYDAGLSSAGLSLHNVPGLGDVISAGPSTVQSRPVWLGNGVDPKFNPAAKCTDQPLPSLESETRTIRLRPAPRVKRQRFSPATLKKLFGEERTNKLLGIKP